MSEQLDLRANRSADVLGIAGIRTTSTSLDFIDPTTTIDEWSLVGEKASALLDVGKWWLADWLVFGEECYGERYAQAASITNRSVEGLRNMASVARRVHRDVRRASLSFGHHEEVAALPRAEQVAWLDRAETDKLTRNELRAHIRAVRERRITPGVMPGVTSGSEPLLLSPLPTPCETAWEDVLAAVAAAKKARAEGGDWTEALRRLRVEVENAVECDQLVVVGEADE